MSIILSDDINDNRGEDLSKRVDTIYDYIAYMKEQLEFWARNRTREISNADKGITSLHEHVDENTEAIADLEPRIQAYENDIELGNTITVNKPVLPDCGIQPKDSDGVTGVEILPTRPGDRLGGRIKLDRGESTARDAYIDTYEGKLRFIDRNPDTAVRASLDLGTGTFDANGLTVNGESVIVPSAIKYGSVTVAAGSIAAGGTKWVSAEPQSGHTMIAFNGYYFQNNGGTLCTAYASYIDVTDNKMWVAIKNWGSAAASPNVIFSYSYI